MASSKKSKARLLAESGLEKLSYDACRECLKNSNWVIATKFSEETFGEMFISMWENEKIKCPKINDYLSIFDNPPSDCDYLLEHIMEANNGKQ